MARESKPPTQRMPVKITDTLEKNNLEEKRIIYNYSTHGPKTKNWSHLIKLNRTLNNSLVCILYLYNIITVVLRPLFLRAVQALMGT